MTACRPVLDGTSSLAAGQNKMLMKTATVVQVFHASMTCFKFYCMFYFICDHSFRTTVGYSTLSLEASFPLKIIRPYCRERPRWPAEQFFWVIPCFRPRIRSGCCESGNCNWYVLRAADKRSGQWTLVVDSPEENSSDEQKLTEKLLTNSLTNFFCRTTSLTKNYSLTK